jgi:hypothetical protein
MSQSPGSEKNWGFAVKKALSHFKVGRSERADCRVALRSTRNDRCFLVLRHLLVHVTPEPLLAGLGRGYNRVLRGVVVPGGVLVFGRVAAAHVAALLTHAQVHPSVAEGHTLGAGMLGGSFEAGEGREVLAGFGFSFRHGGGD